jgi:short-subunit dehydrogenase
MNVVITGGHSGIGLELTNKLLADNHQLALVVRDQARVEQIKAKLGCVVG